MPLSWINIKTLLSDRGLGPSTTTKKSGCGSDAVQYFDDYNLNVEVELRLIEIGLNESILVHSEYRSAEVAIVRLAERNHVVVIEVPK